MTGKIPALILTFDRYHPFARHIIDVYDSVWSDHPFRFIVPYQEDRSSFEGIPSDRIKFIKSDSEIKSTLLALVSEFEDDDLVYWCIDDKFPISLDKAIHENAIRYLADKPDIDGMLLCRTRTHWWRSRLGKLIKLPQYSFDFFERNTLEQFWLHQFLRVKVLRFAIGLLGDEVVNAKDMDSYIPMANIEERFKLWVTDSSHISFGESTTRGEVTKNCYESIYLDRKIIDDGEWTISNLDIVISGKESRFRKLLGWIR